MTDYSDLLSNVRDYTETTSDVLTDAIINQFIKLLWNILLKKKIVLFIIIKK